VEPEYITYQKFDNMAEARALAQRLADNEIPYKLEDQLADGTGAFRLEYLVKIKSEDFETADDLLNPDNEGDIEREAEARDGEYYLFSFTDDELMEVIADADEWNDYDVELARKILGDRGKPINEAQLASIHEQREAELHQPARPQTAWIIFGYMMALAGGVIGIAIGLQLYNEQKKLPDGEKIYTYSDRDRKHGRRIYTLGFVVIGVLIVYQILWK
jgi:hypothetical protein